MGRTLRRRRTKRKEYFLQSENYEKRNDIILERLIAWMKSENWSPTSDLTCYHFSKTGRGLRALKSIPSDETIVKIPRNLLITTSNISQSCIKHILTNKEKLFDAQSALAAFLIYESHLGEESKWKPYLDSIPKVFSNPYFCTSGEKKYLPVYILDLLNAQSAKIKRTYLALIYALRNSSREYCEKKECLHRRQVPHKDILTFARYQWAYFVVNTRAVYLQLDDNEDEQTGYRNDNLALAPFLDLFNHSFDASVKTGLTKDLNSADFYQITTLKPFDEGSQVFINYGPHDNVKLYVEYGFFMADNPLDEIPFLLSDINRFIDLSDVRLNFIRTNGFDKKMGFHSNGLNYNAKIALFVAVTKSERKEWLMKIYGQEIGDNLSSDDVLYLAMKILECKKIELTKLFDEMKLLRKFSPSFKIALELVQEHIRLLELSNDCLSNGSSTI